MGFFKDLLVLLARLIWVALKFVVSYFGDTFQRLYVDRPTNLLGAASAQLLLSLYLSMPEAPQVPEYLDKVLLMFLIGLLFGGLFLHEGFRWILESSKLAGKLPPLMVKILLTAISFVEGGIISLIVLSLANFSETLPVYPLAYQAMAMAGLVLATVAVSIRLHQPENTAR